MEWSSFFGQRHLFNYAFHDCFVFTKHSFTDSVADLASQLGTWEIVAELLAVEINVTFAFIRAIVWEHIGHLDLFIVIEVAKVVVDTMDGDTELDETKGIGVFAGQAHGTLNQAWRYVYWSDVRVVKLADHLVS